MNLYTWNTPNGQKPVLLLEELGASYEIVPIDITAGDQDDAEFRRINPNGKIPALRDGEITIFESGAILLYLAERADRFLPADPARRMDVLSWTFWQVCGLGPMAGQWGNFQRRDERDDYAEQRYRDETVRLLGVLEERLKGGEWLSGAGYTIADMMSWPWVKGIFDLFGPNDEISPQKLPQVHAWSEAIGKREATVRALEKLEKAVSQ